MADREDRLSLLSVEVLISHVQLNLGIECHLPCVVFRLLDYPAVSIPYFDQWQIDDFHNLKRMHPHLSWRQLLSDQFYELRSANGKFAFKRGKSCLFKAYFKTLHAHLLNVPLFILLTDQTNGQQQTDNANTAQFIGSGNVKLNDLIEVLHRSIVKHGSDIPLVEQQTFHCSLFNLMGTSIGNCDLAVRFCHYGTAILTQLSMLDEKPVEKTEIVPKPLPMNQTVTLRPASAELPMPSTDAVVRHLPVANAKKDVGLQLSRCDLPASSQNTKSAQTHWTSMKSRSRESHQARGRYLLAIEDPTIDDPTAACYQPPPLYFNSDSDFLQRMNPVATKIVDEARDNRLSYLASLPIASFDDHPSEPTPSKPPPKPLPRRKVASQVRFQPSAKQPILANDFLSNFPLLRSLVEEALALQQHQTPRQPRQRTPPKTISRSQSARTKSVIVVRKPTHQMSVTKGEVRDLVNRLSKPRPHPHLLEEPSSRPMSTPRRSAKPLPTSRKPTTTYGKTRAHLLLAEYSRARRAKHEAPTEQPPRPESKTVIRSRPIATRTPSPVPLLNKVDVDSSTIEKNIPSRPSVETIQESTSRSVRFSPTASQDMMSKVNPIVIKPISIISDHEGDNDLKNDDLNFSITDVTDFFTDGEDSTRPPTRQSK